MAITVNMEGVTYTISAKDMSGPEIEKAIQGTKKLSTAQETLAQNTKSQFDAIQKHWLGFSVAAGAAIMAVEKVWSMAKIGAGYDEQRSMLDNLSAKYGTTADAIVEAMDRASGYQIAKTDLMTAAMAKGLNPQQLIDLAEAAETLGDAVGKDAATALKDLTEALETGRTQGLKNYLGTTMDLETTFGGLESKMTAVEKSQAMYNTVMIAAIDLQKQQTKETDKAADSLDQVEKKFDDAMLAASRFAKTVFVGLINGFKNTFLSGNDAGTVVDALTVSTEKAAEATVKENTEVKKSAETYQQKNAALKAILQTRKDEKAQVEKNEQAEKKASEDLKKMQAEDLKGLLAGIQAKMDADDENAKATAAVAEEKNKELERLQAEDRKGYLAGIQAKMDADEEEARADAKLQTEKHELIKKNAEQLPQMYRDVYSDIRGYEKNAYEESLKSIQKQADAYKKAGMDQKVIAAWKAEEEKKAYVKMLKSSDDWRDGVKAGLIDITDKQTTWASTATDLVKGFSTDASAAFGTTFRDVVKGDFDDIGDAWTGVWDNALTTFGQRLGDMIVEAAAKDILMMFKAEWTADSSNILGIINQGLTLWNSISGSASGTGGVSGGMATAGGYAGGSYAGFASGGRIPGGSPVWVGERGPELLFTSTPGYVMNHNQSLDYASRSGGYIPGLVSGGITPAQSLATDFLLSRAGFGYSAFPWDLSILYTPHNPTGIWIDTAGNIHDQRKGDGGGFFDKLLGGALFGMFGDDRAVYTLAAIVATYGGYAAGAASAGAASGATASGGTAASSATSLFGIAAAAYEGASAATLLDMAIAYAAAAGTAYLESAIVGSILGQVLTAALGGSGEPRFSFSGANGDLAWLSDSMGKIAPTSNSFGFHLADGIDYVPYDGYRAVLHEGERVQTSAESTNLAKEIKLLREDLNMMAVALARNTAKTARMLEKFDTIGMPTTRTS